MKTRGRMLLAIAALCVLFLAGPSQAMAANDRFDANKMGDMSDFDPNNPVIPTGDTIKIAVVASHSGPAAVVGQIYWISALSVAHDINKRGGITVDGKKKLIEMIKADHQSKVPVCKKICEKMIMQDKVNVLWGTNGSHLMKVINQVADKHKNVIALNTASLSDELMDAENFTRYAFMTSISCEQIGRAAAYYYGHIKENPEKKFYILCQDYTFGHSMADGFKVGLKEYHPAGELVGEDYHRLFLTDFAPYLEKIKASGAEAIYTGDWIPDAANLLKQARQMGITLPFINIFLDEPNFLHAVGIEGTKGLVHVSQYGVAGGSFKTPEQIKYYKAWNELWEAGKWAPPYDTLLYKHGTGNIGSYRAQTYWYLSVLERAGTTDTEKIIKVFEGDTYIYPSGKLMEMRACDHKAIQAIHVEIYVPPEEQKQSMNIPPYYWYKGTCVTGPSYEIPAEKVLPKADPALCK